MSEVITFCNVCKSYADAEAIRDLNLSIEAGEFITVLGASGGGKTTFLKMINGLVEPTSGEITVLGESLKTADLVQLRRKIGYAIQGSVLFPHLTVEENIAYVPNLWNKSDKERTKKAVVKWMEIVGLDASLGGRYPGELSGGQQQRVGIARALAASPELLLMDEPFGAVDALLRRQLQDEIRAIHARGGLTIVFVTHDVEEALRLGTRVLILKDGRIEQFAAPEEIEAHPATDFVRQLVEKV
ncbi:ABC transporter ATP-binding protein [Selenomonas sputigena]|uniref:ABC transporter ATP-binding protein n=1 Tax=Selenomonas sputigena TaxID=69823 RepID=A0ABV3X562_9FIRM